MAADRAAIGRSKRDRTRALLIEAATRVFARLGPDAPTIDDFVSEAGVARGTFYNYFTSIQELLEAAAVAAVEQVQVEWAALRRLPDPADRLCSTVRSYIAQAGRDTVWGWVIVRVALVTAPIGPQMRADLNQDITEGIAAGRFHVQSVQAACDLVLGAGIMGMRSVLRGEAGADHPAAVAHMLLTALGVPDAADLVTLAIDLEALAARGMRQHEIDRAPFV